MLVLAAFLILFVIYTETDSHRIKSFTTSRYLRELMEESRNSASMTPGLKVVVYTLCIGSGGKSYDCERIKRNRDNYAKAVGQSSFIQSKRDSIIQDIAWQKVTDFKSVAKGYDWVWILDADALIMNKRISVASLIQSVQDIYSREIDIIISKDCFDFNSGSFFMRNSDWTDKFIDRWISHSSNKSIPRIDIWWEQAVLIEMIKNNEMDVNKHLAVVQQSMLNSYANEGCGASYKPGDLAVHNPGRGYNDLVKNLNDHNYSPV
jgi:mannan polymerase II complex MNN10 subunit